jgi:drug/metabolite transporter (DMT)-like permease
MTDLASTGRPTSLPALDSVGLGAMIAAVLAIAWSPILIRFSDVAPAATAFWRLVFSLPVLLVWARAEANRAGGQPMATLLSRPGLIAAILAGVAFSGDLAFYHAALPLTSIANASFISNLAPVASVVAGFLLLRDRLRPLVLVALAMALVGVVVTSGAYHGGFAMGRGDLLATAAALAYAFYLVALRVSRNSRLAADVTLISTIAAALCLLAIALTEGGTLVPHTSEGWAVVVGLGLICQVLGQGLSAVGIGRLPAGVVAIILLSHPILSAILAYFVFGEALTLDQVIGGVLILGAVMMTRINMK